MHISRISTILPSFYCFSSFSPSLSLSPPPHSLYSSFYLLFSLPLHHSTSIPCYCLLLIPFGMSCAVSISVNAFIVFRWTVNDSLAVFTWVNKTNTCSIQFSHNIHHVWLCVDTIKINIAIFLPFFSLSLSIYCFVDFKVFIFFVAVVFVAPSFYPLQLLRLFSDLSFI